MHSIKYLHFNFFPSIEDVSKVMGKNLNKFLSLHNQLLLSNRPKHHPKFDI